ncbi:MAG: LysE family translocator [Verrucomicrobiae bacterium]|nr:LysE family translocator [Verrucomicrobiae bacterium]MCX7721481.1 LysE family translocator [Verrucomicrobiae bacterium]MDW7979333.1 LysE family transporter [Verrucomicrobiales bacterium]
MLELSPITLAGVTGFVSGVLLAMPVGPVNLTIMNEGARRGFAWAMMIGLGAVFMETIYCTIAFTGFASFFSRGYVQAAMELVSFVFMLFLGLRFILARSVTAPTRLFPSKPELEERIEARLERRFHPHSAFMTGFLRVLANPGVLVVWVVLAANFISRGWVQPEYPGTRSACITGVALGGTVWFATFSWLVSLGHRRFSERTLLKIEHLSGVGLLLLAVVHGVNIVLQLARHKM